MSAAVTQRPGRLDLELVQGDDASLELSFVDADAVAVDLSGRAWSLRIAGPGLYVELDSAVDTTDEATGVLVVPFAAATTAAIGRDVTWSLRDTTNKRTLLDGELRAYVAGHAGAGSSSIEQTVTITNATAAVTVTAAVVGPPGSGGGGGGVSLGETSTTAYRGDRGKTAYDHSQVVSGNPHGTTAADIGAAATSHTHTGTQVTVDASGFNGNLTTSDDTLQEVAQKLDDLTIPAAGVPVVAASKVASSVAYGTPLYPPVATGGTVAVGLGDMVAIVATSAPATLAKVGYEVTATSATSGQVCKLGCYAVNTDGSIGALSWSEDLPADAVAGVMRTLSTTRAVPALRAWVILNPFANAGSVTFRAWFPHPSHVGITSTYHNRFGFGLAASVTALPSDLSAYKWNETDSAGSSYWGHNNYLAMPCLVGVT